MAIRCSTRRDGDFHPTKVPRDELTVRRRTLVDLPWTMLDQRHGTDVVRVTEGGSGDGERGDIAITDIDDAVLGCWVGDCAAIVLIGAAREFAIVHAGWRGLASGVIDHAVAAFDEPIIDAVLGPVIGVCCYEFGLGDLVDVAAGVGAEPASITGVTQTGSMGLDMTAAVDAACRRHGFAVSTIAGCTGCGDDTFSYRVRGDTRRHVVAAWRPGSTS
ncbi:MAG: polyphenol oxidase family protein [Ilumatobacteraceae bacterium]